MYGLNTTTAPVDEELTAAACREATVPFDAVHIFGDFTPFIEELLKLLYSPGCVLVSVGHVTPGIALAADGAGIELKETLGCSPFAGEVSPALTTVRGAQDIIYLSNPNPITGTTYSRADLKRLLSAVPGGALIVDERLFGYTGLTALPLLQSSDNLIILRSFAALHNAPSDGAGYLVAGRRMISVIRGTLPPGVISSQVRQAVLSEKRGDESRARHRKEISDESFRIATELTRLGIQCRTTPANFLLIRVASVKDTGNFLTANKVPVENLNGYSRMKNYLRYFLESRQTNDRLLDAFRRMPHECYRGTTLDSRMIKLCRRDGELSEKQRSDDDTAMRCRAFVARHGDEAIEHSTPSKPSGSGMEKVPARRLSDKSND